MSHRRGDGSPGADGASWPLVVFLAVTIAAAVLLRGGFFTAGRVIFAGLAGAALLAAVAIDERLSLRALVAAPVLVLMAIGALSALSAVWSVGDGAESVRTGLVVVGFAALAIVGAAVAGRRGGVERLAVVIVAIAAVEALLGLAGVVLREEPWAQRIGGSWRPGGTFEYPPALALLQVCALPAVLRWMTGARLAVAVAAAVACALSGEVLGLSDSRLQVGLAGLVALAAILWPGAASQVSRRGPLAASGLMLACGLGAHAVAGGYAAPAASGRDLWRLVALTSIALGAAAAWVPLRRWATRGATSAPREGSSRAFRVRRLAAAGAAGLVLLVAALAVSAPVKGSGGFTHGRTGLWGDAVSIAGERPVAGHGSESFLAASRSRQERPAVRFAHNLPLEFAVELGLIGLCLMLALYAVCATVAFRARGSPELWLFGPAVAGFLVTNLVDWPWHFAGAGAVFAGALGGLIPAVWADSPREA